VVSRFSRKQKSVALSSAEAEYMAASQASCEALWLRKLLVGLYGVQLRPTMIYCDNQSLLNSLRIRFFTTGLSTLRLGITSSGIMFREEQLRYSTYLQISRLRTYSPKPWAKASLYSSGTSLEW
jgi:hypothetical protein